MIREGQCAASLCQQLKNLFSLILLDTCRKNAADIDLNRNFPDYFRINSSPIQVETRAVMNWMSQVPFILSAGLHGGALVASYPYENHKNIGSRIVKPDSYAESIKVLI